MATSYTSLLGFALPVTGELSGTWGDVVNQSITELVEDAIAGSSTASVTSGDWTLSTTGLGAANEARSAILIPTGTPGVSRNIIAPGTSKAYIVDNQSNAAVVVKASATTGATVAAGTAALVVWDGSDFVLVAQDLANAQGVLAVAKGGTGATSLTGVLKGNGTSAFTAGQVNLASEVTGTLPVANGGTGASTLATNNVLLGNGTSPLQTVAPGTSGNILTSNGTTWASAPPAPGGIEYVLKTANYTASDKEGVLADTSGGAFTITLPLSPSAGDQCVIADAGSSFGTNNLTVGRNGSTIGGLAENLVLDITGVSVQFVYDGTTWEVYAQVGGNGGSVVTLDGVQTLTNKTINGSNNTITNISLSTAITGTLGVANGGTGATSLTANAVLVGNGTSAVQSVAPGTSGNVLTSNGTAWVSSVPAGGGSWELITTINASGASTVDIVYSSYGFDNYVVMVDKMTPSANNPLYARIQTGNTWRTGTFYYYRNLYDGSIINQSFWNLLGGSQFTLFIYLLNTTSTQFPSIFGMGSGASGGTPASTPVFSGHYGDSGPSQGIRLYMSSGTLTGSLRLYGIKNT